MPRSSVSMAYRAVRRITGPMVEAVAIGSWFLIGVSALRSRPSPAFAHGVATHDSQRLPFRLFRRTDPVRCRKHLLLSPETSFDFWYGQADRNASPLRGAADWPIWRGFRAGSNRSALVSPYLAGANCMRSPQTVDKPLSDEADLTHGPACFIRVSGSQRSAERKLRC